MEITNRPPRRRASIAVSNPAGPPNQARSFGTKFSLPTFVKRVDKLTQRQKDAVIRTGFGNLLLIGNHMISKNVLVELMERWHPQKQAFVLGKGEVIRMTTLDVVLILGLRVIGQPVNIVGELDIPFLELEREYGAALWNRKITVASIDKRLDDLGENDDDDFVRSFLLFTFGTILFPNSSGKLDSRYLFLLQDLDSVGKFAWGVAVLEDLFSWLSKRKEINVRYVGGCLILLQIWFYEHIDVARPRLRNHPIKFPRACRWDNTKSHQRDWSIIQFKNLQSNQISRSFQLTLEELELEIVKELLASQRERVTPHIDFDSDAGCVLANEKHNPDLIPSSSDVSDNQGDGVLENVRRCQHVSKKGSTRQFRSPGNLALTSMTNQHSSRPDSCTPHQKQIPNFIDVSDVCNNQGDGIWANISSCQQASEKGCSDLSRSSSNSALASMTDQHHSAPATFCRQEKHHRNSLSSSNDACNNQVTGILANEKQISNFIAMRNDVFNNQDDGALVNNDCSNHSMSISDLASKSSEDQCSSRSAFSCPQVIQRLNFSDTSSDDNEDESTSEDSVMKREISKLRMENSELRKEVESLKHQNLLHLPAFYTLTRLKDIVFSKIADEVLGTNL